ncbi:AAA family ATPase [Halopelagius fulvigenes]|uniref:AAA family ATPase n=1 Tax=Halopelagius fulvigenes TaxID=1198324 RepID=A0ABD5U4Z3_9EURY
MIIIVCGLPASGKTTLSTGLRRRLSDRGYSFESLHSDDYDRRTYERMYEDTAERYERAGTGATVDLILDGTFFERRWRNRFYRLDTTYEVWVRASLSTCLERNRERADAIPEEGLRAIHARFEPPRADLEIDTEALDAEAALNRLEEAVLGWMRERRENGEERKQ